MELGRCFHELNTNVVQHDRFHWKKDPFADSKRQTSIFWPSSNSVRSKNERRDHCSRRLRHKQAAVRTLFVEPVLSTIDDYITVVTGRQKLQNAYVRPPFPETIAERYGQTLFRDANINQFSVVEDPFDSIQEENIAIIKPTGNFQNFLKKKSIGSNNSNEPIDVTTIFTSSPPPSLIFNPSSNPRPPPNLLRPPPPPPPPPAPPPAPPSPPQTFSPFAASSFSFSTPLPTSEISNHLDGHKKPITESNSSRNKLIDDNKRKLHSEVSSSPAKINRDSMSLLKSTWGSLIEELRGFDRKKLKRVIPVELKHYLSPSAISSDEGVISSQRALRVLVGSNNCNDNISNDDWIEDPLKLGR